MISLASSRARGSKKWSDAHKRTIDPADLAAQSTAIPYICDADVVSHAVAERARGPWLAPGVSSLI